MGVSGFRFSVIATKAYFCRPGRIAGRLYRPARPKPRGLSRVRPANCSRRSPWPTQVAHAGLPVFDFISAAAGVIRARKVYCKVGVQIRGASAAAANRIQRPAPE